MRVEFCNRSKINFKWTRAKVIEVLKFRGIILSVRKEGEAKRKETKCNEKFNTKEATTQILVQFFLVNHTVWVAYIIFRTALPI